MNEPERKFYGIDFPNPTFPGIDSWLETMGCTNFIKQPFLPSGSTVVKNPQIAEPDDIDIYIMSIKRLNKEEYRPKDYLKTLGDNPSPDFLKPAPIPIEDVVKILEEYRQSARSTAYSPISRELPLDSPEVKRVIDELWHR